MSTITQMDTHKSLLFTFDMRTVVPLNELCEKYYPDLKRSTIMNMAREQLFGFPVFRASRSQKSAWMVNLKDVAECFDEEASKARRDFAQMRAVS